MKLIKTLTCILTLSLCSFGGRVTEQHTFDSGSLQNIAAPTIEVPGASKPLQAVTLELEVDRAFEGYFQNNSGAPTEVLMTFFPEVEIGLVGGIVRDLNPFITSNTVVGPTTWTYSSGVESTTFSFTFTDTKTLNLFKESLVVIPLEFRGGYTMHANGGQGQSGVTSGYSWRGSVTYTY